MNTVLSCLMAIAGLLTGADTALATAASPARPAAAAVADSRPLGCEIRLLDTAGTTRLQAVVFAKGPLAGTFQLEVRQTSRGGSADITQDGAFELVEAGTTVLGAMELGARPADISARMRLDSGGTTADCTAGAGLPL